MAWLTNLLRRGESREDEEAAKAETTLQRQHPPLLLLVSDASGPAALRVLEFDDAQAAGEYLEFWHPRQQARTVYAVWALPNEPDGSWPTPPERRGEAIVLIQDDKREDIVYPFSFTDLRTAWEFIRHEMRNGLVPGNVLVYWAVPIDIETDNVGKVQLHPSAPPPCTNAPINVAQVATHVGDAVQPAIEVAPEESAPAFNEDQPEDEMMQEQVDTDEDTAGGKAGDERTVPVHALPELVVEKFGTPFHDLEFADETVESVTENGTQDTNGNGNGHENGHSERQSELAQSATEEITVNGSNGHEPESQHNGGHDSGGAEPKRVPSDRYEVADEVARVLEGRRFERKEGPFTGFNSPRGRF